MSRADEWDSALSELQSAEVSDFGFTAFYTAPTFQFAGTSRRRQFRGAVASQMQLSSFTAQTRRQDVTDMQASHIQVHVVKQTRQRLRLSLRRRRLQLASAQRHFRFIPAVWRPHGALRLIIRLLRRSGGMTLGDLGLWIRQWGIHAAARPVPDLGRYPGLFVEARPGQWRLTPWVRLNVPFQTTFIHSSSGGSYLAEATRFWIERGHQPSEEEEWHPQVRQQVEQVLNTAPLPPYFVPSAAGPFQQITPRGRKHYRLDVEHLPEGPYFTLFSPHGNLIFSVEGRAFLMDAPQGVSVITPWATRRLRDALMLNEEDQTIGWHPAGRAFKTQCQACQITLLPV